MVTVRLIVTSSYHDVATGEGPAEGRPSACRGGPSRAAACQHTEQSPDGRVAEACPRSPEWLSRWQWSPPGPLAVEQAGVGVGGDALPPCWGVGRFRSSVPGSRSRPEGPFSCLLAYPVLGVTAFHGLTDKNAGPSLRCDFLWYFHLRTHLLWSPAALELPSQGRVRWSQPGWAEQSWRLQGAQGPWWSRPCHVLAGWPARKTRARLQGCREG